jgi:hypothetical protein
LNHEVETRDYEKYGYDGHILAATGEFMITFMR